MNRLKIVITIVATATAGLAFAAGTAIGGKVPPGLLRATLPAPPALAKKPGPAHGATGARGVSVAALSTVVRQYCGSCHSENLKTRKGNLTLTTYDLDSSLTNLAVSEKMIRKLRADMMPPPNSRRPGGDTLLALVETMEQMIDRGSKPNPGARPFQRLNRPEYEAAIKDLFGLTVNAGQWLPLDTKSANFDNIADVQALSPLLLESYLTAAGAVSRMAVGDLTSGSTMVTYDASPFSSQHPWNHVEGTPYGTRGGLATAHVFPADGQYQFRLKVAGGIGTRLEDLDISIDGVRVALLHHENRMESALASADFPLGYDWVRSAPIDITGGEHKVTVAFVRRVEGPYEDIVKPHDWSNASNGNASQGTTEPPKLVEATIIGPTKVTGLSETPSRKAIFVCRPAANATPAAARACADTIVTRLGNKAYRRPLTEHDREALLAFYDKSASSPFDERVRTAIQAMLASPYFVFRFEKAPEGVAAGTDYKLSDYDLASRLSFFLWGTIPDDELLGLAAKKQLSEPKTLEKQVKRMLADPRSEALSTRFAGQWLRLQDLDKVHPDAFFFPDYNQNLADAMRRETELLFNDIVRRNASVLELFTADYTFVNEQLSKHYGIPNVAGTSFQKVKYPDETRRGLLGHGSILVQTSLANRTSPVLRGKWVMEVLIGMPPPPPPPDVPDLTETAAAKDGKPLTTRERMEIHRANPTCKACHQYMDPIGLSLDNFDVTGKWRYREGGQPLDTRGTLYDGSPVSSPADLQRALLKRPIPLMRSFTENLMAYAVGRRVEDFDQPAIRAIAKEAEANGYKFSSFVMGVVNSSAFRMKRAEVVAAPAGSDVPNSRQR